METTQSVTRFVGIDVGAERHVLACVDETGGVLLKTLVFAEDAEGYAALGRALGGEETGRVLVGMEATGHYWQNLAAYLLARGVALVLINPLRTHRFSQEDLSRTKTDAQDALGIARFLQQKHPPVRALPDALTLELKEAVALRERLLEDWDAKKNALHRLVDLGFPEFTHHVKDVG
jgi:transposase